VEIDALAVNISAETWANVSWQYGRNINAAIAIPISVSSKSPGKGFAIMKPVNEEIEDITTTDPSTRHPRRAQYSIKRMGSLISFPFNFLSNSIIKIIL
jgi:hypothetical protein